MADAWKEKGTYIIENETPTGRQQMKLSSLEARKINRQLNALFKMKCE